MAYKNKNDIMVYQNLIKIYLIPKFIQLYICPPDPQCNMLVQRVYLCLSNRESQSTDKTFEETETAGSDKNTAHLNFKCGSFLPFLEEKNPLL